MALRLDWLAMAAAFVRLRPKTSAAIAFEIGILAAQALTRSKSKGRASTGPSRFIALAPSLANFEDYLPGRAKPKRRRKPAAKRGPARIKKATRKATDSAAGTGGQ